MATRPIENFTRTKVKRVKDSNLISNSHPETYAQTTARPNFEFLVLASALAQVSSSIQTSTARDGCAEISSIEEIDHYEEKQFNKGNLSPILFMFDGESMCSSQRLLFDENHR